LKFSFCNFQFSMVSLPSSARSFRHEYPYWLPPALVALALTLIYLNPFIGDWDALDYTIFSLHARPSSMALGRSLFTIFNFACTGWRTPCSESARSTPTCFSNMQVVIETPIAVVACWVFARDLTGSARAATLAALMIACSPILVIYGGQVMTEIPSVLLTAIALAIHLRGIQNKRWWLLAGRRGRSGPGGESARNRGVVCALARHRAIRCRIQV
jgi:hypothetical protein